MNNCHNILLLFSILIFSCGVARRTVVYDKQIDNQMTLEKSLFTYSSTDRIIEICYGKDSLMTMTARGRLNMSDTKGFVRIEGSEELQIAVLDIRSMTVVHENPSPGQMAKGVVIAAIIVLAVGAAFAYYFVHALNF